MFFNVVYLSYATDICIYIFFFFFLSLCPYHSGEDDDDSIDFDDHPQHTIMSLSFSLSVLSLIESSFVRANRTTKHNETLMYTLSLLLYTIG